MFSLRDIFRLVQTLAVPIIFGLVLKYALPKSDSNAPSPSLYVPILADIGFTPRSFPSTYRVDSDDVTQYERVQNVSSGVPDTSAVVLNWSRFPNVLLITSLLCGEWLDDVISEVFIWNNNPRALTYEDFKTTGCPKEKLTIHNAPMNLYFQGRFMGCAEARSKYCFVQDDDYLVRSEIIHALHARMVESKSSSGIHLTPPREHLTSTLREIHVPKPDPSYLADIHTSFAWLGYGAMITRSQAISFISLLRRIRVSGDEMKMADNFFTILSNQVPEIWFDHEFELGGGQPFSVGPEGEERNNRYILKATEYLDSIAHCNAPSCSPGAEAKPARSKLPYVSFEASLPPSAWKRAVCMGSSCVLETNIRLLPEDLGHTSTSVQNMLALEKHNLQLLGDSGKQHYIDFAPSMAVDSRSDTAFISPSNAASGDIISVDMLADVSDANEWAAVEMVWLVNPDAKTILDACIFEFSSDGDIWHRTSDGLTCHDTGVEFTRDGSDDAANPAHLLECSVPMSSEDSKSRTFGRYFRARLQEDRTSSWAVHEVWLRGTRRDTQGDATAGAPSSEGSPAHVEL